MSSSLALERDSLDVTRGDMSLARGWRMATGDLVCSGTQHGTLGLVWVDGQFG